MANTVIGSSMIINGEISSEQDMVIEGAVKGRVIIKGDLYIGRAASITADIQTRNVQIAGHVNGNIAANQKVEIAGGGRAVGDVKAQRILIADGAIFKGNVDMGI
jgi:cytoskeletal protein CcmA (bactofilin family)